MHLKIRNESGLKLGKANEFCDITDKFRSWPRLEETVLGLHWTITIFAHVNVNEFEPCWEEEAFAEVQRKIVCLAVDPLIPIDGQTVNSQAHTERQHHSNVL
jgi:hypothetical protein